MFNKILFVLFIAISVLFPSGTGALDIAATGGWSETINASDLVSGAGSDLTGTYTSTNSATRLRITNATNNADTWRVDMQRTDSTWHNDFTLSIIRRINNPKLSGGSSWTEIRTATDTFLLGRGNFNRINCRYRLQGMSVNIPPNTYITTVTFTIVDT